MAQQRPLRRRDRHSRFDDDYVDPYTAAYNQANPYAQPLSQGGRGRDPYVTDTSPPRQRHTTRPERHRRHVSSGPDYVGDTVESPRRRHNRQEDPRAHYESREPRDPRRGRSAGPDRPRRGRSPPAYAYDESDNERPRRSRGHRSGRPERGHEAQWVDPYEARSGQRQSRRHPAEYSALQERSSEARRRARSMGYDGNRDSANHRDRNYHAATSKPRSQLSQNPRHGSPPRGAAYASRNHGPRSRHSDGEDSDGYGGRRRRRRQASPGQGYQGQDVETGSRRNRGREASQSRNKSQGPPRGPSRGRTPTTSQGQRDRSRPAARRNSMPATPKTPRTPWWQNPMVQAGARNALSAGAKAAIKNSSDPSPWIGPKGAKVATAALGAALVDGFMGQKHPGSMRQNLMREGVDVATARAAAAADTPAARRHNGRH